MDKGKVGLLLINLGTPDSPDAKDVKSYLKEFLMDPLVIDIPFIFRWFLVNQIILKTRPTLTASLYKKIWTDIGSPLLIHTLALAKEVQLSLGDKFIVAPAMRYGRPSIKEALEKLKLENVERILTLPLYPQYSLAATQSSIEECKRVKTALNLNQKIEFYPAFYDHPRFIEAFTEILMLNTGETKYEKIILSFHGVPERHVKKTDATKNYCLKSQSCCEKITEENKNCYRAQCFATARAMAEKLRISNDEYHVSFQSRLGRTPWIKPYTDFLYEELAKKGVKKIAVVCPSFVADCLETLEEVAIRGREQFIKAGGGELKFIPSLNSNTTWVKAIVSMVKEFERRPVQ